MFDSHGLRAKQSIDSLPLDRVGIFFNIGEVNSITLHAKTVNLPLIYFFMICFILRGGIPSSTIPG